MRRLATLLLASFAISTANAQVPNERTREREENARVSNSGAHAKMHHMGVDREAAIGHALCMAIEGSALWHCAQKAEAVEAKSDRKAVNEQAMRDPGPILEKHAKDAFRASDQLFQAVMQDETLKDRNIDKEKEADHKSSLSAEHMARHKACEEFFRAARDYSRALETSCSNTRQAGAQVATSTNSDACVENAAKVALINHAVEEAVQGVALHQMLLHHGEHDRTSQALESHAEQMIASSRHAIDWIDGGSAKNMQAKTDLRSPKAAADNTNAPERPQARNNEGILRREAARPTYNDERAHSNIKAGETITVQQLARLGRELIRAVDRLNDNAEHSRN